MPVTNTHTATDKELVSEILGGNHRAYSDLVKQTERLVAQIVFKMIPIPADHKDVAQDVYLKVYASLPNFRFHSKLSTYIGQVAYNICLHYLEKKRPTLLHSFTANAVPDYEFGHFTLQAETALESEAEARLYAKDLEGIFHTVLLELPPLYQTLVALYHQQELPLSEIAEITSLPIGTVKSYLFRARRQLRDILLRNYKKEEL